MSRAGAAAERRGSLPASDAVLYYFLLPSITDASLIDEYRALLSPEERQRTDSFVFQRDRDQRLASRAMLRKALADVTGRCPAVWKFRASPHGRPEIEAPEDYRDLKFNVSHSGALSACLVSWHRLIGIDVELIKRVDEALQIADRHFAPPEIAYLRAAAAHEMERRFLQLWTLKEAYFKALGSGLSGPLNEVIFGVDRGTVAASFGAGIADDPARWQFDLREIDGYVVATAVERRGGANARIVMHDAAGLMNCA
jgi:4'-phosphopantetheinyl transferase